MSLVPGLLAACLHPAPSAVAIGFSLLLVLWLATAEEVELRRGRRLRSEVGRPAVAPLPPPGAV